MKVEMKRRKRKRIMDKFINRIICFIAITVASVIMLSQQASATFNDNTPDYHIENYDYVTEFWAEKRGLGTDSYRLSADFSKADKMYIPHAIVVLNCCGNTRIPSTNFLRVSVDGNQIYYDDRMVAVDAIYRASIVDTVVDVRSIKNTNAVIDYDVKMINLQCQNCGQTPGTQFVIMGIKLVDERAKVTSFETNKSVKVGDTVTLNYSFSENTSRVCWGIRYSGEGQFSPLNEGVNANGLVANGVTNRSITLSNIPGNGGGFDVGVFVYDENGDLPAGTSANITPFFTKISVEDNEGPTIDVKKTIDTIKKAVVVTITGTDNVALHSTPYSWDGGATFEAQNTKEYTTPGVIKVAVRDSFGNTAMKDVYIDAVEIEKANPNSGNGSGGATIQDKEPSTGKGTSSSGSGTSGAGTGIGAGGEGTKSPSGSGSGAGTTLDKVKEGSKEFTSNNTNPSDSLKESTTAKKSGTGTSFKDNSSGKDASLKAKELSEADSKDVFDRIRNNSEEYIISMRETFNEEQKMSNADSASIDLEEINEDKEGSEFNSEYTEQVNGYKPDRFEKSWVVFVIIAILVLLLILFLMFVLFFGVLILVEKQTEYTRLSGTGGIKVPVGISFVVFENGVSTVCFREILNKHEVVYARFGAIFSYMYENDKVKIMTKFKGEKKREIATEIIHKEIVVGNKGGSKI